MTDYVVDFNLEDEDLNANFEIKEGEVFNAILLLDVIGSLWGNISGDINNQTDLIELLDLKADKSEVESITGALADSITAEVTARENADTTLNDKINVIDAALSDSIANLTDTVEGYNTALNDRIDTVADNLQSEAATRANNDVVLQNNINNLSDSLTAEIGNRASADTILQGNINSLDNKVDSLTGALDDRIDTLSDTVRANYNTLDDKIDSVNGTLSDSITAVDDKYSSITGGLSDSITAIESTINTFGDIVTYNAADFATSLQGALADTALQPNDNISELVNDVGYITSASLPTVNNATITIQKNGADVGTFTLNQANNDTLNIAVPTQASDIGAMPDTTTIEDLTTTAQLNALNSGATVTNIGQITTNENNITDIRSLIPSQASTSNQLADESFVNSSIATNTAYFIGTFNSVAELEAYSGTLTNNDYAFVATTDSAGNTLYDRYKYNADTQQWIFEYELNNSSFTAQQWVSINSGITSGDVTLIDTALQPNDNISELINDAGYITSASLPTVNNGTLDIQVNSTSIGTFTANQSGNTTVNIVVPDSATWGNITGILSNQTDLQTALNSKYDASNPNGYTSNVGTVTSVNNIQPVSGNVTLSIPTATSDLTNDSGFITNSALTPYALIANIPTKTSDLTNNSGFITGISSNDVEAALGYTPVSTENVLGLFNNRAALDLSNITSMGTIISNEFNTVNTALDSKANTDLSNLSTTGKLALYSNYVSSHLDIANSASYPTTTNIQIDLSSYLPNDGNNYFVLFRFECTTGTTSGNQAGMYVSSDLETYSINLGKTRTRTTSSVNCAGSGYIPIGTGRVLNIVANSSFTGTYTAALLGYIRMGTNL